MYPHCNNLVGKIAKETPGTPKHTDLSKLKSRYDDYRSAMQAINYQARNIVDFDRAASELQNYLIEVDNVVSTYHLMPTDKLRPSVLEELSVFLFENHPALVTGEMEIFNRSVYAGVVVDRTLGYQIHPKNVDFCIGKQTDMTINGVTKTVRFPFVCVEVKTYVDATMNHEILFSGTQIKSASPEAKTYLLQEFQDEIGANHPIPASYNYAIDRRFNLRDCRRTDPVALPIVGQHLLDYYIEVADSL